MSTPLKKTVFLPAGEHIIRIRSSSGGGVKLSPLTLVPLIGEVIGDIAGTGAISALVSKQARTAVTITATGVPGTARRKGAQTSFALSATGLPALTDRKGALKTAPVTATGVPSVTDRKGALKVVPFPATGVATVSGQRDARTTSALTAVGLPDATASRNAARAVYVTVEGRTEISLATETSRQQPVQLTATGLPVVALLKTGRSTAPVIGVGVSAVALRKAAGTPAVGVTAQGQATATVAKGAREAIAFTSVGTPFIELLRYRPVVAPPLTAQGAISAAVWRGAGHWVLANGTGTIGANVVKGALRTTALTAGGQVNIVRTAQKSTSAALAAYAAVTAKGRKAALKALALSAASDIGALLVPLEIHNFWVRFQAAGDVAATIAKGSRKLAINVLHGYVNGTVAKNVTVGLAALGIGEPLVTVAGHGLFGLDVGASVGLGIYAELAKALDPIDVRAGLGVAATFEHEGVLHPVLASGLAVGVQLQHVPSTNVQLVYSVMDSAAFYDRAFVIQKLLCYAQAQPKPSTPMVVGVTVVPDE